MNFIQIDLEICGKISEKFLISHTSVTLNEVQGHSNRYKSVEFRGLIIVQEIGL